MHNKTINQICLWCVWIDILTKQLNFLNNLDFFMMKFFV